MNMWSWADLPSIASVSCAHGRHRPAHACDQANQALVKKALEILPDRAIREPGDEDIAQWIVVRVNDDICVDLMTEACGVRYEDAAGGIETELIDGVAIPFASADLMLTNL